MKSGPRSKPDESFNKPKKTTCVLMGTWNAKTHQVAKEMNNKKCKIVGLSKVRLFVVDKLQ